MPPRLDQLNQQTNSTKSIWSLCWSLSLSFFSLFSTWLPVKNRRQLPLVFYPLRQCKLPGNKCLLEFENLTLWNNTPIKLYINRRNLCFVYSPSATPTIQIASPVGLYQIPRTRAGFLTLAIENGLPLQIGIGELFDTHHVVGKTVTLIIFINLGWKEN